MNVSEETLVKMSRWQMVAMLRCKADEKGNEENRQFQRGVRYTSKKQLQKYSQQANENFLLQMINLSDHNPKKNIPTYIHDLSETEPDFVNEKEDQEEFLRYQNSSAQSRSSARNGDRARGCNATNFRQEILESINDESRKLVVEVKEDVEIKRIEDIKDYLKLLLVTIPINTFKPTNPSGINVGGVKENQEYTDALNGTGQKDLERQLLEKLKTGELTKHCEILCKKIRSLTETGQNLTEDGKVKYQRIIFCSDEKTIKKFRRCKNKNSQKNPRSKKPRNLQRTFHRPLTKDRLTSHSQRSGSASSASAIRLEHRKKDSESIYSQTALHFPGSITITNSQLKPSNRASRAR